jgi:uncharacterized protein (TIGR03435 family)
MRAVILASVLLAHAFTATAQSNAPPFEVASVKISPPTTGPIPVRSGTPLPGGGWVAQNARFIDLLRSAYPDHRLPGLIAGGPDWINRTRFDIVAKAASEPSSREDLLAMVRRLLADRFALRVHTESRELEANALILNRPDGRLGPRMRLSTTDCEQARREKRTRDADGRPVCTASATDTNDVTMHLRAGAVPIATLIMFLQGSLREPILDRTGLTGLYDIDLDWLADSSLTARGDSTDAAAQTVFAAVTQQLGLRLERRREKMDVLVIDSVALPQPD